MADRIDVDGLLRRLDERAAYSVGVPSDWMSLCREAASALRSLRDERDAQRLVLEGIAGRGCGIPGHAVAVGCGSNVIARKALEGEYVRHCPDCHGHGSRWSFDVVPNGQNAAQRVPCETCERKGLVAAAPSPKGREGAAT